MKALHTGRFFLAVAIGVAATGLFWFASTQYKYFNGWIEKGYARDFPSFPSLGSEMEGFRNATVIVYRYDRAYRGDRIRLVTTLAPGGFEEGVRAHPNWVVEPSKSTVLGAIEAIREFAPQMLKQWNQENPPVAIPTVPRHGAKGWLAYDPKSKRLWADFMLYGQERRRSRAVRVQSLRRGGDGLQRRLVDVGGLGRIEEEQHPLLGLLLRQRDRALLHD